MARTTKNTKAADTVQAEKAAYTKEQILASAKFCNRSDLADALLKEGKTYTLEEVDQMIAKYLKGKVR